MITSFSDKGTSDLFNGVNSRQARKVPNQIYEKALLKLDTLNAARTLDDLKSPPGNKLKILKGNLKVFLQHSD